MDRGLLSFPLDILLLCVDWSLSSNPMLRKKKTRSRLSLLLGRYCSTTSSSSLIMLLTSACLLVCVHQSFSLSIGALKVPYMYAELRLLLYRLCSVSLIIENEWSLRPLRERRRLKMSSKWWFPLLLPHPDNWCSRRCQTGHHHQLMSRSCLF